MSRGEASVQSKTTSRESGMGRRGGMAWDEEPNEGTKEDNDGPKGSDEVARRDYLPNEEQRTKNEESKMHRHQVRSPTHAKCERKLHLSLMSWTWALDYLQQTSAGRKIREGVL